MILDANARVGDSWRQRWDSLRLFTPARFDGLDGMPFPAPPRYVPDQGRDGGLPRGAMRARFPLPVRNGVRVDRLSREGDRYVVTAGEARASRRAQVVVAMASYQKPRVPAFAGELDAGHRPAPLAATTATPRSCAPAGVLIVGAGNSGAEIALELRRPATRCVMAGRDVGHVPFRFQSRPSRGSSCRCSFCASSSTGCSRVDTPLGRKAKPRGGTRRARR